MTFVKRTVNSKDSHNVLVLLATLQPLWPGLYPLSKLVSTTRRGTRFSTTDTISKGKSVLLLEKHWLMQTTKFRCELESVVGCMITTVSVHHFLLQHTLTADIDGSTSRLLLFFFSIMIIGSQLAWILLCNFLGKSELQHTFINLPPPPSPHCPPPPPPTQSQKERVFCCWRSTDLRKLPSVQESDGTFGNPGSVEFQQEDSGQSQEWTNCEAEHSHGWGVQMSCLQMRWALMETTKQDTILPVRYHVLSDFSLNLYINSIEQLLFFPPPGYLSCPCPFNYSIFSIMVATRTDCDVFLLYFFSFFTS